MASNCALTQDYNLDCRDSFGGLNTVYLIEFAGATPAAAVLGVIPSITNLTGQKWRKYALIAHTGEADEVFTPSRENGTVNSKQHVKFPINKMTVSVRNEILLLAQNRLLMIIVDENGGAWLYGKDYGMMLGATGAKTGKTLGDRNGYDLSFEGDEKYLAQSVATTVLATLQVTGV